MVLGDRNPNRTRLGQRENSLTHTHTWGKAGRSAGCIARPQMYAWNEEVFHCPYHLAQYTHMPTTLLPISFSQIEGNPPADLYVPISPPERVKTCFFSSDLKLKNPRKGFIGIIWIWSPYLYRKAGGWQEYHSSLDYMCSPGTINSGWGGGIYKPRETPVYTPKLKRKKDFPAERCTLV